MAGRPSLLTRACWYNTLASENRLPERACDGCSWKFWKLCSGFREERQGRRSSTKPRPAEHLLCDSAVLDVLSQVAPLKLLHSVTGRVGTAHQKSRYRWAMPTLRLCSGPIAPGFREVFCPSPISGKRPIVGGAVLPLPPPTLSPKGEESVLTDSSRTRWSSARPKKRPVARRPCCRRDSSRPWSIRSSPLPSADGRVRPGTGSRSCP